MLKEKIVYPEGLPLNCSVVNIVDYPIHFHDDMEVIFVLDGSIVLKNGYYTYTMKKGDIFILNDREIHSYYETDEPNVVLLLQLDLSYFCKYYEILRNSFFVTDMKDGEDESLERLRDILSRIQLELLTPEPGHERRALESTHCLIDCLINDFQYFAMEDGKFVNEPRAKGNKILTERLNRITDYLYENYNRRLTLNEIAEREHLSIYYLSHVIKEATGLCFQDLLNFIRVEESEKLLLGSRKKIGEISVESGFSAVRYYIKYFTKWFGMHPEEYRKAYTGHVKSRETPARFTTLPAELSEKYLLEFINDVYDFASHRKTLMVAAEIDPLLLAGNPSDWKEEMQSLLLEHALRPGLEGLELLLDLGEALVAWGADYIVTAPLEKGIPIGNRFSFLFLHLGEPLPLTAYRESSLEEMRETVSNLTGRAEFLIKLAGLSGTYRLTRCQFSRECILEGYDKAVGDTTPTGKRERLAKRIMERPVPSVETVHVADGLAIPCFLSGFSTELVLADLIEY
ncbi:MAG: hypothetical protein CVU86_07520 [Firmicutes bacterium HGW-Firmicutes-11]|jgi:AraC-like DNA-binding protein|nr:MAG: hypothetical protein CVU86_07520 [Firmicutes bacterium HGW-Firmicutes-11]